MHVSSLVYSAATIVVCCVPIQHSDLFLCKFCALSLGIALNLDVNSLALCTFPFGAFGAHIFVLMPLGSCIIVLAHTLCAHAPVLMPLHSCPCSQPHASVLMPVCSCSCVLLPLCLCLCAHDATALVSPVCVYSP